MIRPIAFNIILLFVLSMSGVTVQAADDGDIVEFQGDRYVIHVDKMGVDSEMTLLDVLNTCPEFLSINGKKIDQNYKLRVDNINLVVDVETFLANVKACEIDRIHVCSNTSVAKAVGGTKGVIDVYYRDDVKTDGKVAVTGSTYGNGMAYADVANKSEGLTVRGYALARTSYGKAYPTGVYKMTDRGLTENVHLKLFIHLGKNVNDENRFCETGNAQAGNISVADSRAIVYGLFELCRSLQRHASKGYGVGSDATPHSHLAGSDYQGGVQFAVHRHTVGGLAHHRIRTRGNA